MPWPEWLYVTTAVVVIISQVVSIAAGVFFAIDQRRQRREVLAVDPYQPLTLTVTPNPAWVDEVLADETGTDDGPVR